MTERKSKKRLGRKLVLFGLLAILMMTGAGIFILLFAGMQPKGKIPQQLVGTWRSVRTHDPHGLGDTIWDLRADGTARWRLSSGKSLGSGGNTIGYFEWWTEDPKLLVMHQYSSKAAARRARLISAVLGPVGGRTDYELVEVSDDEFTIRSKRGGKEATYRRTNDDMIESAP